MLLISLEFACIYISIAPLTPPVHSLSALKHPIVLLPSPLRISSFMTLSHRDARLTLCVARRHGLSHITHDAFLSGPRYRGWGGMSPEPLSAQGETPLTHHQRHQRTDPQPRPCSRVNNVEHVLELRHLRPCYRHSHLDEAVSLRPPVSLTLMAKAYLFGRSPLSAGRPFHMSTMTLLSASIFSLTS